MKIKTNFVAGVQPLLAPLGWAVSLSVILSLAGLLWVILNSITTRNELPELRLKLSKLETVQPVAERQAIPADRELKQTRAQVTRLNSISQGRGLATLALLSRLEALLPNDTVLVALHHRAKEGELQLLAQGASAELLSKFLQRLEEDAQLESVVLSHQKEVKEGDKVLVQFEIRAKVRP